MPRRKKTFGLTSATQTMIIGFFLAFAAVLVFFANKEYLDWSLTPIFWPDYRWFFSPIAFLVWLHMVIGRSEFDLRRWVGLLLYWVAIVSLWGNFSGTSEPIFDLHIQFLGWFDKIPTLFLLFTCLFLSLYLLFHVSYRKIFHGMTDFGSYAYRKQVEMLNSLWSERAKAEKLSLTPEEEKRLKSRNEELESKIEKLSWKKLLSAQKPETKKSSFFDKIREKWTDIGEWISEGQTIFSRGTDRSRSIPITSKNASRASSTSGKIHYGSWEYPWSNLLQNHPKGKPLTREEIELQSAIIERTLLQFGIEVTMAGFEVGPTVTQYRLKPSEWVKLNKIEALKKDLTLALKAVNIRIQAPIPGLGFVGIEVPNPRRDIVSLREIAESSIFVKHPSKLAMCVGSGIAGNPIVCDLKDMPHLLIAGQTGSGKSVWVNGFLISLLLRNSPEELKFVMIDPKRVELNMYNGIPHLLAPVINHSDKALNALKWCVAEMIRRYDIFTEARAKNLSEYNAKAWKEDRMPAIVIVIDELAELMMSSNKKEAEGTIVRIAQMARAVGMHLIIATQRPSVDVITGLIKANVPSRIAFTVVSQIDSRTVLDQIGAEDLLGRWDMLFSPVGTLEPERIQGVFVNTAEVENVIHFIKMHTDPELVAHMFETDITEPPKQEGGMGNWWSGESGEEDEAVVQQAIEVVRSSGKASTSLLQRRLKLGYARAARVMDILEEMGIIGPADGSKPREVY